MKKLTVFILIAALVLCTGCFQKLDGDGMVYYDDGSGDDREPATGTVYAGGPTGGDSVETVTERMTELSYSYGYVSMSAVLPDGWEGEEAPYDPKAPEAGCGISFRPVAAPEMNFDLRWYPEMIGICGTGVTFKDVTVAGWPATECTEGGWYHLVIKDAPGEYYIDCAAEQELWKLYGAAFEAILSTVKLGGQAVSRPEAVAAADAVCEIDAYSTWTRFNIETGVTQVRYRSEKDEVQIVYVSPDGEILDDTWEF